MELVSVEDVFENDEVVLMKARYKLEGGYILNTDVGVKDEFGDIKKVITAHSRLILGE